LEWRSSEAKEYLAFKGLAAYISRLLGTSSNFKRAPDNVMAAANFRKITSNRNELMWVETADRLGLTVNS